MLAEVPPRPTYLAAPYRHPSRSVCDARMEAVSRVAPGLTDIDRSVFCPLTYAQALLAHGFEHRDDRWWYEHGAGRLPDSVCFWSMLMIAYPLNLEGVRDMTNLVE